MAVLHCDVGYVLHLVSADDEHAIVALLAGHILHAHLAHGRLEATVAQLSWLVVEVDFQDGFLALAHGDVAHIDVLDESATAVVGLDAEDALQVRGVHHAVLGVYILASARDLRADDHAAMSIFHLAIADDDVLARLIPETTVIISAALDGDAVVAGMEYAVLDEHVLACLWVAAVAVRSFIPYGYAIHGYVLAEQWMDDPEWGVEHLDTLDEDALGADEIDELRTQALAQAKLALIESHTVFGLLEELGTRAQALSLLGFALLVVEVLVSAHRPPGVHVAAAIDGTLAGDGDVGGLVGVDAWRIVPASQSLP